MKTIQVNLYEFSELSDKAKERALNDWNYDNDYFWGHEGIESLKAYLGHFGCDLFNYEIDFLEPYRNSYSMHYPDLEEEEIKNLLDQLGEYNPATLKGIGECKLTGVCFDEDLIDGFRKEWYEGERNIEDLILAGIANWETAMRQDCEYYYSEEGYNETCEANEYWFNEEGELQ